MSDGPTPREIEIKPASNTQKFRDELKTHFRQMVDINAAREGDAWVNSPIYTPAAVDRVEAGRQNDFKVHGVEPESEGRLVDLFNSAIYNTIFEGKPLEETGAHKRLTRLENRSDSSSTFLSDIDVYRMPVVDEPAGPNDFFYLVSQQGYRRITHPSVLTGLVQGADGEKHQAILSTKWDDKQSSGVMNYGYLSEDQVLGFVQATTGKDAKGVLADPEDAATSIVSTIVETRPQAEQNLEQVNPLPEKGWGAAQEQLLDPSTVFGIAKGLASEFSQLPLYQQATPHLDQTGTEARKFEHNGAHIAVVRVAPEFPEDLPRHVVFKSATPLRAGFLGDEGAPNKIDAEDLEQYSFDKGRISYIGPEVADNMQSKGRQGFRPFRPGVDREEDKTAKINKIGVKQEFDRLLTNLKSPKQS